MPSTQARVSVVVLTHNRRDEVLATLQCLLANLAGDAPVPVIVVDNGSSDGTAQAIRQAFPDITVVLSNRNLGAAGRNLGVDRVRTPYVAFCDDDTCWEPGAVQRAAGILDQNPHIAVVNAHILVGPERRSDPTCTAMAGSPLGCIGEYRLLLGFMAGACVMRTQCFLAAGGYWQKLFIGGEETLLALDFAAKGWHMVYAPEVVTRHLPSPRRNAPQRRHLLVRNAIWTAWLRMPASSAWQESARALRAVPTWHQRLHVVMAVLAGAVPVLQGRRVIPRNVQSMRRMLQSTISQ
nr:glycosyltransferase [Pseudomonas sp.]